MLKEQTIQYLEEHLSAAFECVSNGSSLIDYGMACDYPLTCAVTVR